MERLVKNVNEIFIRKVGDSLWGPAWLAAYMRSTLDMEQCWWSWGVKEAAG